MSDSLGEWDRKYTAEWEALQRRAAFDQTTAVLERRDFEGLPEYSLTLPTGVYANKVWKRREPADPRSQPCRWYLGQYEPPIDGQCLIVWRDLLVVDQEPSGDA